MWHALTSRWQSERSAAGLAWLRICVALQVLFDACTWWREDQINDQVLAPEIFFHYHLFGWVRPPVGLMPYAYVLVLMGLAVAVAIGWRTRWTAALLSAGWWYWFLIDATNYSDHAVFVGWLTLLVACLPTARAGSVDAYVGREKTNTAPVWTLDLAQAQLVWVQFCWACSLFNADWLAGAPLAEWLAVNDADPTQLRTWPAGTVEVLAWGLPILTVIALAGLCWRRSAPTCVALLTAWSLLDYFWLHLGISPLLQAFTWPIFLPLAWLEAAGRLVQQTVWRIPFWSLVWLVLSRVGRLIDGAVGWFDDTPVFGEATKPRPVDAPAPVAPGISGWTWGLVSAWCVIQVVLPWRFVGWPGPADWTDLATTFAWRGQHRVKQTTGKFSVIQPSQLLRWQLEPTDEFPVPLALLFTESELASWHLDEGALRDLVGGPDITLGHRIQSYGITDEVASRILRSYEQTAHLRLTEPQFRKLLDRPELVRQYAHRVGEILSPLVGEELEVTAELIVSYNNRPAQVFLANDVNLWEQTSAQTLSHELASLKTKLPPEAERIESAQAWTLQRQKELDMEFDIIRADGKRPGEPIKAPPLSDEDERWFQEKYGKKQ